MSSKFFTKTLPFWAFGLLASASLLALGHDAVFRFFKKTVAAATEITSPESGRQKKSSTTSTAFLSPPPCAGTAVGGLVWRDFNNNGVREAGETRVVPGVTVNVFDCNGALIQTTTTDATGTWVVSAGVSVGQQVRVEYCNIPAPFLPSKFGTNNGTTIQFVTVPNCTVDLGVNNPDDFCQTDPAVKIPCFVNGLRSMSGSSPAIVNFQYNGNSVSNDLNFSEIGTAWGLAWDRTTKFMYASAFLKRHTDLGPLGLGGIYKLDYSGGGAPVMTNFYTVPNVGTVVRPADLAGLTDPNVDADAFGKIGKVGLGDIDISPDGNTLWTVNLSTRMLVKISNVLSGSATSSEIAIGSAPSCTNGIFRPFALKFYAGKVWLGGVCTGETGGTSSNLNFSVHSFDPVANTWAMELQHDLFPPNYQHGDIVSSTGECGEFETWADVYDEKNVIVNGEGPFDADGTFEKVAPNFRCRGQAWLCDIEFSDAGFMLIAFMDRTGHQLGYVNHRPTGPIPGDMISSNNGGDIVAANKVGATWQVESNGTIPGGGPTSAGGVGNAQGPGGGEFFYQNTGAGHLDNDAGGLVVVSGKNEVLSAVLDPNNTFGGGVNWYNLTTGGTNKSLVVYAPPIGQTGLGKANGLGDMEALCDPQPMEIGNYVWHDQNSNGKQDPCELPLSGVNVSIFKWNGTKVGMTTTNAAGQYYFNNSNVDTLGGSSFTGLRPGTPYYVVIGEGGQFDPGTGKLQNLYSLVTPDQGMGCAADENDSDGTPMPAGQPGALGALVGYPWFCVPPPPPGSSCHSKDFGFSSCVPITLTMLCDGTTTVPPGGTVNICPGASKMLTIQSTPAGNVIWSTGATTATITVSAAGMYSVTVTEPASGCTASQSVTVANPSDPCVCSPLTLSMVCNGTTNVPNGSTVGLCPGASKTLTISATPAGGTILWSNGASTPTITVTATGMYSVTVTNAGGCSQTHSVTVNTTTIGCGPTCANPTPVKTWHNLTPTDRTTLKNGGMVTDFNTGHCYDADGIPATPSVPMLVKITASAAPNSPTPGVINARLPGKAGDDGFRLGRMMSGTSGVMYCLDFATPTSLLLDSRTHNCLTASEKVIITASYVGNPVALSATMNGVPGPATAMVGGAGNSTATLMANGKQGCGAWWEVHSNQQLVDRICIQYFRTNAAEEPGEEPFTLKICGDDCVVVPPYVCSQSNRITRWGSFTNAERMELLGMDNDPDGDGNRVSGFDSGLCDDNGDPVRVHVSGAPAFGPGANTSLINARKPRNWDNGDFFMARQTSGAGTGVTYCFDLDEPSPVELNSREHAYFDSSEHVVVRAWLGPDPVNVVGTLNGTAIAPATVTGSGTPQVVFDANGKKGRGVWWQATTASCVTRVCVSYYRTNAAETPGVEPFQIRACGTSCNPAPPVTCNDPEPITRWNRLTPSQCNSLEDNDMTTNVEDIHTGFCDESGDPIYMDIDIMGAPHAADPNTINNKRCGRWGQTSFNNTREVATNSGTKSCFTFTEAMPACVSSREHQHFTDGERVCVTAYLGNDPVTLTGSLNGPVSTATMSGNNTFEVCFNANGEQGDQVWWEVCTGNKPVTTICVEYYRNPGTDAFGNEPFDVMICNSNRCLFEEKFSCMHPSNPNMNSPACQEDNLVLTKETFCVDPAASGIAGNVDVTFRLKLTNNGTSMVTKLQMEEDLRDHFPANVLVSVVGVSFGAGNTAAANPTLNAGFNGTTDVHLFNGTTGQLNGGQTLVVDLKLQLNPSNLPAYGDYANFVFAAGETTTGKRVTTSSDAPPNTPGNTPPDNPTDATWIWIPSITVAKRAINLTSDCTMQAGDVQFDLEFIIQNTGNVNLDRLTMAEDLATQLGGVFKSLVGSPTIVGSTATTNPIFNADYNGKTNVQVFNGTSGLLAPGQTVTVRIRVLANPNASGCAAAIPTNQSTVTARGVHPNGTPLPGCNNGEMIVRDKSDTGSTPESQNPGVPGDTGGSDDPTRLPLPSLSVAKHIAGVDCATSGKPGQFDVIFEVILENTGNTDLSNFHLLDNMTAAGQYGSAFHAMVQAPHIVAAGAYGTLTNAATNPSVNATYNGSGDLLAGGGLLHPCERVVVQFRIEVNPDAAGAPANPANQAQGCADGTSFTGGVATVCDDSDSGYQPESNNPNRPGDTGKACDPTPLTNCHEDAGTPVCNDLVQASMDENCIAVIDPDDVLEGGNDNCMDSDLLPLGSYFSMSFVDQFGNPVPDGDPSTANDYEIGAAYLGQTLTVKVTDVVFKNSCWGQITFEDKLAPEIFCENQTIPCTLDVTAALKPIAVDNCTTAVVQLVSSQQIDANACLGNDVKYRRCWVAVDAFGNTSQACCDTVTIVRPTAPDFPSDIIWTCDQYAAFPNITAATALHKFIKDSDLATPDLIDVFLDPLCDDSDAAGTDNPNSNSTNTTNGGTGCPGNGLDDADVLKLTGSGIVSNIEGTFCMFQASYEDQVLTSCGESFKIVRTWTVLDWCTAQVVTSGLDADDNVQVIKVIDEKPPVILRPPFNVSANLPANHPQPCSSTGFLLPATITDNCNTWTVKIFTPIGEAIYLPGSNGNGGSIPAPGLPLETHTITYQATDACGNEANLNVQVTVVDDYVPFAICDEITDANLGSLGVVEVFAETFDDGSYDNCCLHHFEVRRMEDPCNDGHDDTKFGPSVIFCCADVGTSRTVVFRVFDCHGNFNDCMVQVEVSDKVPPLLNNCPANQRVTCDWYSQNLEASLFGIENNALLTAAQKDAQEDVFLTPFFGMPSFVDNCSPIITPQVTLNIDQCLEGRIIRTWTARDQAGNIAQQTCVQTIFVDHVSDFVVEFPADVTINCGTTPPDFGEPEIFFETCELVAVSFVDEIFTVVPDACFKLVRQWTVINWCVVGVEIDEEVVESSERAFQLAFPNEPCDFDGDGDCDTRTFRDSWRTNPKSKPGASNATQTTNPDTDPDSDPWDGFITYEQVIKVQDTVDPVFANGCAIPDVCIEGTNCVASFVLPTPDIQECSPQVTLTAQINLGSGFVSQGANGFGAYFNVPPGTYPVRYTAIDNCNNQTVCNTSVKVKDCKLPTPYCKAGIVVELMVVDPPMVVVWAVDLNDNSFDNCPGALKFSFSQNVNDISRTYDCDDFGANEDTLWVTDAAGNQDFCTTIVNIQANQNQCAGGSPQVAGNTVTAESKGVEGVSVSINSTGGFAENVATNAAGQFNFGEVPAGGDYTLTPQLDVEPLNGVTTFDLVLISKHILGVQPLGSPYKIIAADANHSGSVTTFDMVELRKLILFINADFPNNTSWRFVDKAFVFPNPVNPFQTSFPEVVNLNDLSADKLSSDFIAIKVGDVNGNAATNFAGANEDRNVVGTLVFDVKDASHEASESFAVDFTAKDFAASGFQFTMNFDPSKLEFVQVGEGVLGAENFGTTLLGEGALTCSWNGEMAGISSENTLFRLIFKAKTSVKLSEVLSVGSRFTQAEAYVGEHDPQGSPLYVKLAFDGQATTGEFELYQNTPNPFAGQTVIGFYLPETCTATLTVSDVQGRLVKTMNGEFAKGYNEIRLERKDLPASGVLNYQLVTPTHSATRTMLKMD